MNLVQHILILAIRAYRLVIAPAQIYFFGGDSGCRFTPTCSQYAMEAVRRHGALTGSWLATKRVCRCHPFGDCGHDPVPVKPESHPSHLLKI
ncbi:MAG: membrane protein insertion efficiency factor YidD [Limisphaerales bacterium]